MKVKCKYCRHDIEFDETEFSPGEKISVECPRCGDDMEVVIPGREHEEEVKKPEVRVTRIVPEDERKEEEVTAPVAARLEVKPRGEAAEGFTFEEKTPEGAKAADKRPPKTSKKKTKQIKDEVKDTEGHLSAPTSGKTKGTDVKQVSTPPPIPSKKPRNPSKPQSVSNPESQGSGTVQNPPRTYTNLGCLIWIVVLVGGAIGCIWALRGCSGSGKAAEQADSAVVEVWEVVEGVPEGLGSNNFYEEETMDSIIPGDIAYDAAFFTDSDNRGVIPSKSTYVQTGSGLKYVVVTEGGGESPKENDTVTVHYIGRLTDGTVFDSSVTRDEPSTFPLNRVIAGWTEGLQTMKVGGRSVFYLPSALAYGENGVPGTIPGNASLIFEVELLGIQKKDSNREENISDLPESDQPSRANCKMGFYPGKNSFKGEMIHTDERRFPFTLDFNYFPEDDRITDVVYVNTTSGTKLKLETKEFTDSQVRFEGMDSGKVFIIQFSDTPYTGDAWWGDFHQDIELRHM